MPGPGRSLVGAEPARRCMIGHRVGISCSRTRAVGSAARRIIRPLCLWQWHPVRLRTFWNGPAAWDHALGDGSLMKQASKLVGSFVGPRRLGAGSGMVEQEMQGSVRQGPLDSTPNKPGKELARRRVPREDSPQRRERDRCQIGSG